MGVFWTEESIKDYEEAVSLLNYPEDPMGPFLREVIKADDTVLDVGAGVGTITRFMAPMCKEVTALEMDEDAGAYILREAKAIGQDNVKVWPGMWPDENLPSYDVVVMAYVYRVFNSIESIRSLIKTAKRAGVLMTTQPGRQGFMAELPRELGLEDQEVNCHNEGCRIMAMLEAEGIKVKCDRVYHDFGQPVKDVADAAKFMHRMLKIDDKYLPQIEKIADKYIEDKKGQLYVPHVRTNCIITFEK